MAESEITETEVDINEYEVDLTPDSEDYRKIQELRGIEWTMQKWEPSGAWLYSGPSGLQKVRGTVDHPLEEAALAELGLTDDAELQFVEDGWTIDHCQICTIDLFETDDEINGQGWKSGNRWVCHECYRLLVGPDAVFGGKFPASDAAKMPV